MIPLFNTFICCHLEAVQPVAHNWYSVAAIDRTENQILRVNIHGKRQEAIYLVLQEDFAKFGAFSFTILRSRNQSQGDFTMILMILRFDHSINFLFILAYNKHNYSNILNN